MGLFPFSRGSLMMDVVAASMLVVVPTLAASLFALQKHDYVLHKRLQIALSSMLGVVVLLFEIEVRLNDWRPAARPSPYYDSILFPVLYFHLFMAISTTVLWILTLVTAVRGFRDPAGPRPGPESGRHRRLGPVAAFFMFGTAATGWTFFWLAFVA